MYVISMDILCLDGYLSVLPGQDAHIELVIECMVALILLDFFGVVVVDSVKASCFPAAPSRPPICSLQVQATCPAGAITVPAKSLENKLEGAIGCALTELFHTVVINTITVQRRHDDTLDIATLPRSA